MEPRSHSCPRCEWLVLGSKTGHSPFPEENKRIEDDHVRRSSEGNGKVSNLPLHEDNTGFSWTHRNDQRWEFYWPLGYKAWTGECDLLQFFITSFQDHGNVDSNDFTIKCSFRGILLCDHAHDGKATTLLVYLGTGAAKVIWQHPCIHFELFLSTNDSCAQWSTTRPIQLRPDHDACFALIRSWIRDCQLEHIQASPKTDTSHSPPRTNSTYCSSGGDYVPNRLIHVELIGSHWRVSLIDSSKNLNSSVPYLALSYCWGGDQVFKTTKKSMNTGQGMVDYDHLPATIQDACRVTSKLGYSYLWIDALCIIQDDEVDMQKEIANMKHIYSNAILTIAASRASSSVEGFLQTREHVTVFPLKMRATGNTDEAFGEVSLMKSIVERDIQPLDGRAWALQESVLSSRMLEFTSAVTRFSCVTSCKQERSPFRYRTDVYRGHRGGIDTSWDSNIVPSKFADLKAVEKYWWRIVLTYTKRELSVPVDRPLAISGIAERLSQQMTDLADPGLHVAYIAGHWSNTLSKSLNWSIDSQPLPRPKTYQGPSWSWLSVSGSIRYHDNNIEAYEDEAKTAIELCDYKIQLKDENAPFGAVVNATLTVRCYISQVILKDERSTANEDSGDIIIHTRNEDDMNENSREWLQTSTKFDTSEDVQEWDSQDIFIMQIENFHGLVDTILLQYDATVDGIRRFRRLGRSTIWCYDDTSTWAQDWHREVIQLI